MGVLRQSMIGSIEEQRKVLCEVGFLNQLPAQESELTHCVRPSLKNAPSDVINLSLSITRIIVLL